MSIETTIIEDSISAQRETILAGNCNDCFIERERVLGEYDGVASNVMPEYRFSEGLAYLLSRLSTPINTYETVLGRMIEGELPGIKATPEGGDWRQYTNWNILGSAGHMTLDYAMMLQNGFDGIAAIANENANRINTPKAHIFARNVRITADAIKKFALRYAEAARLAAAHSEEIRAKELERACHVLERVPHGPAFDFFSAVQSIWFTHFIASTAVGGRDFAFGRMDQYLYPYFQNDRNKGLLSDEEATSILAQFFLKTNEIAGGASTFCGTKPIPSSASKQYIILGGNSANGNDCTNDLSLLFFEAAKLVRMREPVLAFRYDPRYKNSPYNRAAIEASIDLQGQVQLMNERLIPASLIRRGVPIEDAYDFTASGCSRIDIGPTHSCHDRFVYPVFWLNEFLENNGVPIEYENMESLLDSFRKKLTKDFAAMTPDLLNDNEPFWDHGFLNDGGEHFHFESLLVKDAVTKCRNICDGGARYTFHMFSFAGIANAVNILMTIEWLVFIEKRYSLAQLVAIAQKDFEGSNELLTEIRTKIPKFGNDIPEVDMLAKRFSSLLIDVLENIEMPEENIVYGSFNSWVGHNNAGWDKNATLDGRRKGEPFSENQSPVYGTDTKGITALFKSVCSLPFDRACSGTLNLKFASGIPAEKIQALLETYFKMGGSFVGINVVDRETLLDAIEKPEEYRSLQIRLHGYSEYFVMLPKHLQQEIVNRTEYR